MVQLESDLQTEESQPQLTPRPMCKTVPCFKPLGLLGYLLAIFIHKTDYKYYTSCPESSNMPTLAKDESNENITLEHHSYYFT
jgi:hypothetical protein